MANNKKSISSRIEEDVYDKLIAVSKKENHKFYDRKIAYMVTKILESWVNKEKNI